MKSITLIDILLDKWVLPYVVVGMIVLLFVIPELIECRKEKVEWLEFCDKYWMECNKTVWNYNMHTFQSIQGNIGNQLWDVNIGPCECPQNNPSFTITYGC